MKKTLLNIFGVFLLFSTNLIAQQGTVSGTVTDASEALIGVSMAIEGNSIGTATDIDGNYSITLDPGSYTLVASYVGYSNISKNFDISAGESIELNYIMQSGILIDEIVVTGTRHLEEQILILLFPLTLLM